MARSKQWTEAVTIWQSLASRGIAAAMERLAIYHEHRQRDFATALQWTERMRGIDGYAAAAENRRTRLLTRQNALRAREIHR